MNKLNIQPYTVLEESDPFLKECLNYNPWHAEYTRKQPETGRNPDETDRGGWRGYDRVYSHFLSMSKNKPLDICEIGVHSGYGLLSWARYFKDASITGVEISDNFLNLYLNIQKEHPEYSRVNIKFFNSTTDHEWDYHIEGKFDVIIDDGSHLPGDQYHTLANSFRFLRKNGYYFIEDISDRYFNPDNKALFAYLKDLRDKFGHEVSVFSHVNEGWANILRNKDVWKKYGVSEKTPKSAMDYIAVIRKTGDDSNGPRKTSKAYQSP